MCLPRSGIGPAKRAASNNLNRNNQHQVIGSDRQHCRIPQKGCGATTDHSYYRLVGVPGSRALAAPANSLRNLDFLVAQCVALWVTKKADAVPKTNHVGVLVSARGPEQTWRDVRCLVAVGGKQTYRRRGVVFVLSPDAVASDVAKRSHTRPRSTSGSHKSRCDRLGVRNLIPATAPGGAT
jgi:hypothetical protein